MDNFKLVQAPPFYLAGNGISLSDTSIVVNNFAVDGSNLTMTDFGAIGYATIEPNTAREEIISFTGITQNANSTATLTGVTRGLSKKTPWTQDLSLREQHGGNVPLILSNNPQVYNKFTSKDNDETIEGIFTFTKSPIVPTPTTAQQATNKDYVDNVTVAGASDASAETKGVSRNSVSSDVSLGAVTITIASPAVATLTTHGLTLNDSVKFTTTGALPTGITAGIPYYVISAGLTANEFQISTTLGGSAVNTTGTQSGTHTLTKTTPVSAGTLDPRIPTQAENDALAGTSGPPSSTNKYVTDADTATAATADKVARRLANGNVTIATETAGNNTNNAASTAFVQTALSTASITKVLPQQLTASFTNSTGYGLSTITTDITGVSSTNKIYGVSFKSAAGTNINAYSFIEGSLVLDKTASSGWATAATGGIAVCGSYVYTIGFNGSSHITTRYDLNTLANSTSITGGAATSFPMFSDGTKLYVITSAGVVTPYTISGTTLTAGSTITFTSMTQTDYSVWCDGTYVYQATGGTTVYRWALAGGARTQLTDYTVGNPISIAVQDCGYVKQSGNLTSGIRVTSVTSGGGANVQIIPII